MYDVLYDFTLDILNLRKDINAMKRDFILSNYPESKRKKLKTYIRIRQICNLSFHAVCTAHNHDVFFSVAAVKKTGNQISFRQNFLAAYRTTAFGTPLGMGITVRTAHNVHPLVRSVHRAEDAACQFFAFCKGSVTHGAAYKFNLAGFGFLRLQTAFGIVFEGTGQIQPVKH